MLIETVTPSGYNTIQPIIFTIEATYDEESDDPQLNIFDRTDGRRNSFYTKDRRKGRLSVNRCN